MKASTMNGDTLAKQLTALSGREWTFNPSDEPMCTDDDIGLEGTGWSIQITEDGELWLNYMSDGDDCWMRTLTTARDSSKLLNVILRYFKGKTDLQLHELGHCGEIV
jgi:hypothetical protein